MCGRYVQTMPAEVLRQLLHTAGAPPNLAPSWNVAPTQLAPVVRRNPETGERMIDEVTPGGARACGCGRPLRQGEKRCPHCTRVRAAKVKRVIAAGGTTALSVAVLVATKGKVKLRS